MIDTLVVFGAGGDLTRRLLLPAVAVLHAAGDLGPDFRLIGSGEQDWTTADFDDHVRRRLAAHAPAVQDCLAGVVHYRRADVTDPTDVAAVLDLSGGRPVAVYLALPTRLMLGAVQALQAHGLPAGSRIAIEKPFGEDAAGAASLNAALADVAGTDSYRVDHVLAMSAVQQLPDAQVDWSNRQIERVDLLFDETLALEGRASFYDRAGALRDVMQNHLVQMLCVIAAPTPDSAGRAAVLRAVRPLSPDEVRIRTRRARYTAGRLADTGNADGREVPDYANEEGVDPARQTETFAEVVLELDTPQWTGTRFVLRAGKALAERRRGVLIHRRAGGTVWLDIDDPNDAHAAEPAAYQRIVTELLAGTASFAVSAAEAELAWQVFTPVLDAWAAGEVALLTYPAGSAGP